MIDQERRRRKRETDCRVGDVKGGKARCGRRKMERERLGENEKRS